MKVMTRRAACAVVLASACGAHLAGDSDAPPLDGKLVRDGGVDAPVDARPCTGGSSAMVGPDGSCFVLVTTPKAYLQAKAACEAMNAHLAYLKNAALDNFAETFVGNLDTYIGGSDRITEGTFLWEDGAPFVYTNWEANEPSNGGGTYQEDCVVIAGSRAGKQWDDRPCDATEVPTSGSFAYLCNY
jgi:Lectin C-type domain